MSTAAIDQMFRAMCDAGASDLHLCVGTSPMIRKDGHMQPLDPQAPVLSGDDLVSLLAPIMPEKNRKDTPIGTTPTSPTRFRSWPASDRTCSQIAAGRVRCFVSSRRRS